MTTDPLVHLSLSGGFCFIISGRFVSLSPDLLCLRVNFAHLRAAPESHAHALPRRTPAILSQTIAPNEAGLPCGLSFDRGYHWLGSSAVMHRSHVRGLRQNRK